MQILPEVLRIFRCPSPIAEYGPAGSAHRKVVPGVNKRSTRHGRRGHPIEPIVQGVDLDAAWYETSFFSNVSNSPPTLSPTP